MSTTLISGNTTKKLYKLSGQFSSTILSSYDITALDTGTPSVQAVSVSNYPTTTDAAFIGNSQKKAWRLSGQFSATVKSSIDIGNPGYGETSPTGLSWNQDDSIIIGTALDYFAGFDGAFTTTLTHVQAGLIINFNMTGVSHDGTNVPFCGAISGSVSGDLYLMSGYFSSALVTSLHTPVLGRKNPDICATLRGATFDTMFLIPNRAHRWSGQFTTTVLDSIASSAISASETQLTGIDTLSRFGVEISATTATTRAKIVVTATRIVGATTTPTARANITASATVTPTTSPTDVFYCGTSSQAPVGIPLTVRISGEFSTTVKASLRVNPSITPYFFMEDISSNGDDCMFVMTNSNTSKTYRTSGFFSLTIHSSANYDTLVQIHGMVWDGTNTLFAGFGRDVDNGLVQTRKYSGAFTTTLLDTNTLAAGAGGAGVSPKGISWDGTNAIYLRHSAADTLDKAYKLVGFSSTVSVSLNMTSIDGTLTGISWDGQSTLFTGDAHNWLFKTPGQFSTVVTTTALTTMSPSPLGLDISNIGLRLGSGVTDTGHATVTTKAVIVVQPTVDNVTQPTQAVARANMDARASVAYIEAIRTRCTGRCKFVLADATVEHNSNILAAATILTRAVLQAAHAGQQLSNISTAVANGLLYSIEQFTTIASAPTVDYTSAIALTVGGVGVDLTNPHFQLEKYEMTYDGKTLEFAELVEAGYTVPSFTVEQDVTLYALTAGTMFTGKLKGVAYEGRSTGSRYVYRAFGQQLLAKEVANYELNYANSITAVSTTFYGCVSTVTPRVAVTQALQDTFAANTFLGPLQIQDGTLAYLPSGFVGRGSVYEVLQQITSYAPGYRIWYDDYNATYVFANLYAKPITSISFTGFEINEHSLQISTAERFKDVTIYDRGSVDLACLDGWVGTTVETDPAWSEDEADFDIQQTLNTAWNADGSSAATLIGTLSLSTYRAFIADLGLGDLIYFNEYQVSAFTSHNQIRYQGEFDMDGNVINQTEVTTTVTANLGGKAYFIGDYATEGDKVLYGIPSYVPTSVLFNASQVVFIADEPVVFDHVAPYDPTAMLAVSQTSSTQATVAGAVHVNLFHATYHWPAEHQIASTGFGLYGNTRYEQVQFGDVDFSLALQRVLQYTQPIITGDLTIVGPPNIACVHMLYDHIFSGTYLGGPLATEVGRVTGVTYQFGRLGKTIMHYSSDPSNYIRT